MTSLQHSAQLPASLPVVGTKYLGRPSDTGRRAQFGVVVRDQHVADLLFSRWVRKGRHEPTLLVELKLADAADHQTTTALLQTLDTESLYVERMLKWGEISRLFRCGSGDERPNELLKAKDLKSIQFHRTVAPDVYWYHGDARYDDSTGMERADESQGDRITIQTTSNVDSAEVWPRMAFQMAEMLVAIRDLSPQTRDAELTQDDVLTIARSIYDSLGVATQMRLVPLSAEANSRGSLAS